MTQWEQVSKVLEQLGCTVQNIMGASVATKRDETGKVMYTIVWTDDCPDIVRLNTNMALVGIDRLQDLDATKLETAGRYINEKRVIICDLDQRYDTIMDNVMREVHRILPIIQKKSRVKIEPIQLLHQIIGTDPELKYHLRSLSAKRAVAMRDIDNRMKDIFVA